MWGSAAAKAFTCSGASARCSIKGTLRGGCGRLVLFFFLGLLLRGVSLRPVFFKNFPEPPRGPRLLDDDADFATLVELRCSHAHAAEKYLFAIAQHRAHVEPHPGHLFHRETLGFLPDLADDPDIDAGLDA